MTEEVIYDEFPLEEDIRSAVNLYVDDMSKDSLREYVNWNMKDYYINVADGEEAQDFIDTNRDTSVCIEDWEEHILYRCP
tara:strand:- start:170 stop:409 length:240 start_codon:yes stop_codon:yes gene_type:complete